MVYALAYIRGGSAGGRGVRSPLDGVAWTMAVLPWAGYLDRLRGLAP